MDALAKDIAIALTSNPEFKSSIIKHIVGQYTAHQSPVKSVKDVCPVELKPERLPPKENAEITFPTYEEMEHLPQAGFSEPTRMNSNDGRGLIPDLPFVEKRKREEKPVVVKKKPHPPSNSEYDCVTIFASSIANCIGRGGTGDREWELAGIWKKMDPLSYMYCHEKSTHVRHFPGNTYSPFRSFLLNNNNISNNAMQTQLEECSAHMNEPEPWKHIDLSKTEPKNVGISKEKNIIEKMARDRGYAVSYDNIKGVWNAGSGEGYSMVLDEGKWRIMTKTDAIVTDEITGKQIVVDAKNRRRKIDVDADDISNSDFYQIQAYMHIRDVDEGMIVEADDYGNSREIRRKRSDHIWNEIETGLDKFADDIHRLLSKDPQHNRFKLWILYREQKVFDKIRNRRR